MCEPTWWQILSPVWLYRARPTDFEDNGSICAGVMFMPGLLSLLAFHIAFLGFPVAILIRVEWQPAILWLTVPVLLLWAVLIPADIKFRLQGATREQRWLFDLEFINWFGLVTWPVAALAGVFGLVWWVVSLCV